MPTHERGGILPRLPTAAPVTPPASPDSKTTWRVLGAVALWLAFASGLGLSGALYKAPAAVFANLVGGLTLVLLATLWRAKPLRAWALSAPLRPLVLVHLARLASLAFIGLYLRSEVPAAFAIPAAAGDSAVALLAIPIALWALPPTTPRRWTAVLLWNVFGLADLLLATARGLKLAFISVELMVPLSAFPLVLVPLAVVPLGIASHAVVFARLWTMRREVEGLV